ncbi:MAG TPA: LamG-like jellyroll fold domain-containing protein [Candidatus Limnocylindria bacterium]|nr:LamG-like jellyroll fold domain-containing protein [Candidatus Limnocylindria bacterium]
MNLKFPTCRDATAAGRWVVAGLLLGCSATGAFAADYSSTVISQAPVGYWRLNETVQPQPVNDTATNLGTTGHSEDGVYWEDSIKGEPGALGGGGATSTHFSNPGFQVGYFGSTVDIDYNEALNPSGPFSVEFWARPSAVAPDLFAPVASLDIANGGREGFLFYAGTDAGVPGWQFRVGNTSGYVGTVKGGTVTSNAWHYIVGVYDGTQITLYVNGVALPSVNAPGFTPNTEEIFRIGATTIPNRGWDGWVQEVAIYPKALTAADVTSHFGVGSTNGAAYPALVLAGSPAGYWRLNEAADPAIPTAVNLGTLGTDGNGGYIYPVTAGASGPAGASYPGFEAANKAVSLNGTNGYVSLPALNLNTNAVTISAWVNANDTQAKNTGIVFTRTQNSVAGLKTDVNDPNGLAYNWNDADAASNFKSGIAIPNSTWTFVGLSVHPEFSVLVMHDGFSFNYITNFDTVAPVQPFEGEWHIGNDPGSDTVAFNGLIDEVAIFNRSLSLGELFTEYAAAVGGIAPQMFVDLQGPGSDVSSGEPLVLSVDVGGSPDLVYEWKHGTAVIPEATTGTYVKAHAALSDSGSYSVKVSNAYGTVSSQTVGVNVIQLVTPTISQNPLGRTLYPGASYTFSVTASGGLLKYQWKQGTNALQGATSPTLTLSNIASTNAGDYTVVVSNTAGTVTSEVATLTVITPAAGSYEALIVADGPESWWRFGETPGSTQLLDSLGRHDGTYVGGAALSGQPGVLHTGAGSSVLLDGSASYGQIPYSSTLNPTTNFTVEFWVKAAAASSGTELCPISSYSLSGASGRGYAWLKTDGDEWWGVSGNNDQYNYYYVSLGDTDTNRWEQLVLSVDSSGMTYYINGEYLGGPYGDYVKNVSSPFLIGARNNDGAIHQFFQGQVAEVTFYKKALNDDQVKAHYQAALYGNDSLPVFLKQPLSTTVAVTLNTTLVAEVEGTEPITLQWKKGDKIITDATNASLTISNIDFGDAGDYVLVATNPVGSKSSSTASLTVIPLPVSANVTNNLVLHLKFDGDYADASGRGNNASAVGAPGFVAGHIGAQALHYNTDVDSSTFNYVTLGMPDDIQFGTGTSFSVAYWVRLPAGYAGGDLPFICNARGSYSNPGYTFAPSYNDGGWSWSLGDANIYGPNDSINDGKWHHLVHTFDRTGAGITYLDGEMVDSRPIAKSGDLDTGDPTSIGQDPTGEYAETGSADIDDIGIWRRVLTPIEAWTIYYVGDKYSLSFDGGVGGAIIMSLHLQGDGTTEINWAAGKLQQADSPLGPWSDVPGSPSAPYSVTPSAPAKFYRATL